MESGSYSHLALCDGPTKACRGGAVHAVIVTYRPDLERLAELLDVLSSQVASTIVVDNGSLVDLSAWVGLRKDQALHVVSLGKNQGIAAAQNVGIERAKQVGAEYVVLFDQDSVPAADMVEVLRAAAEAKAAEGCVVAAVGPRYVDDRMHNPPPFIQVHGLRIKRHPCTDPAAVVAVDYLIASGCLISMRALDTVGGMREELFIDYVDIEWGLRAGQRGFQCFGACAAKMHHSLGDEPIMFLSRGIPAHNPVRHYYHFRNAVWLYRQAWLPAHWKWADGIRLVLKYGFYAVFAKPRAAHLRMMSLGIWHGLRGRMGRLEATDSSTVA